MKRVKFLQKLLRQIESLQERKEGGEVLDEAQMKKVGRMDEVVKEIEELLDVNLDSTDEDDGANESEDGEDESENESEDENEEDGKQLPVKR